MKPQKQIIDLAKKAATAFTEMGEATGGNAQEARRKHNRAMVALCAALKSEKK